jgi:hypothetical protein
MNSLGWARKYLYHCRADWSEVNVSFQSPLGVQGKGTGALTGALNQCHCGAQHQDALVHKKLH